MALSPSGSPVRNVPAARQTQQYAPQRPSRRHPDYFIGGDVIFLVEDMFFSVHRYFFERESPYFMKEFSKPDDPGKPPRGSSESYPFILEDVKIVDFVRFLWVFYNPAYKHDGASLEEWISILRLAHKWSFPHVLELSLRFIESKPMDTFRRILIYHEFNVSRHLLLPAYTALVSRSQPLSNAEGEQLGLETALAVFRAREYARGSVHRQAGEVKHTSGGVTVDKAEIDRYVRETFFNIPTESPLEKGINDTTLGPRPPAYSSNSFASYTNGAYAYMQQPTTVHGT